MITQKPKGDFEIMINKSYCLIAGAGEAPLEDALICAPSYVIAADGGMALLSKFELLPQLFVGRKMHQSS